MDFPGNFDEFKALVVSLGYQGEWIEKNDNLVQCRTQEGVVINWFPSSNGMNVKGPSKAARAVSRAISVAIAKKTTREAEAEDGAQETDKGLRYTQVASEPEYKMEYDSELVIGLVGAVGTDLKRVKDIISERLGVFNYSCDEIKISSDIISQIANLKEEGYYERTDRLMTAGNDLRKKTGDFGILAKSASININAIRSSRGDGKEKSPMRRHAFIVNSLKHPDEVAALRKIYGNGFYLIGVHSLEVRRKNFLEENKKITADQAKLLIGRDADEVDKFGQHTRDTYHLSDFFVDFGPNGDKFEKDIWRFLDLIFGKPFVTPTFDEYAMFMAFSASLRSADMSRQVGAVVAKDCSIVATGANDVPKFGGGLYWSDYDKEGVRIVDAEDGRDYKRGGDTNVIMKNEIMDDILSKVDEKDRDKFKKAIASSKLKDITEYGRIVHAEMEALLSCARGNISTKDSHIYCTTFPCHNCAKHLVAAGVGRVVYVEPYPKSKALDFHKDSITLESDNKKLKFEPFVGVGPRSFFSLFSVNLGGGYPIVRKKDDGAPVEWSEKAARLRMQMLPLSYIERESANRYYVQQMNLGKIK
jgi:deoxycytidylate deaminase